MLLHTAEDYFDMTKASLPFTTAGEEAEWYFALLSLCLEAYTTAYLDEKGRKAGYAPLPVYARKAVGERDAFLSSYFSASPEDRAQPAASEEARGEIGRAFACVEGRAEKSADHPFGRVIQTFGLSRAQILLLLLSAGANRDEAFAQIYRSLTGRTDGFATADLCRKVIRFCLPGDDGESENNGKPGNYARTADVGTDRVDGNLFAPDSKLYTYLLLHRTDEGKVLLPQEEEPVIILPYAWRLLCGSAEVPSGLERIEAESRTEFFKDEIASIVRDDAENHPNGNGNLFREVAAPDAGDVAYILGQAALRRGKPFYRMDADHLPDAAARKAVLLYLSLYPGMLLIQSADGAVPKAFLKAVRKSLAGMSVYLWGAKAAQTDAGAEYGTEPGVIAIGLCDVGERKKIWEYYLDQTGIALAEDVDLFDIADCHEISYSQIKKVVARARETILAREGKSEPLVLSRQLLQELLFSLSSNDFEELATEIALHYTWEDIYLEENAKQRLKNACDRFRLRNRVGAKWGINRKNAYGNAVIVLMYGAPGTGKTMAAQAIANEVMTPLYRVDVSQIFSKYIGETQKNLSRIFDEAAKRSVVLFFDEADALFTRRTEIKDSHDKYANSDTSFLLQKVEEYNGISILATNNYQSFDPAFMRRLTYVVHFERPDEATRKKMWETMLPKEVPMDADVNFAFLAERFTELSGSNIKSILLTAAYMAGAKRQAVDMQTIVTAIVYEYEKLGRLVDSAEFGEYAMYL